MDTKFSQRKSMVVAAAAAAASAAAAFAQADDSSNSLFARDTYSYFHQDGSRATKAPSTFRMTNPHGIPFSEYQALSSPGAAYHTAPKVDKSMTTFRQISPNGIPFSALQALSSNSSAWQSTSPSASSAIAATDAVDATAAAHMR